MYARFRRLRGEREIYLAPHRGWQCDKVLAKRTDLLSDAQPPSHAKARNGDIPQVLCLRQSLDGASASKSDGGGEDKTDAHEVGERKENTLNTGGSNDRTFVRRTSSESVQQKTQRETGGMSPLRQRQRGAQNRYSCAGKVLCALRELWVYLVWVEPERRYGKLEQIEQEGEWMKKCCVGCKWHEEWTWACCNGDSPYCADFVNCGCPLYEEKEKEGEE